MYSKFGKSLIAGIILSFVIFGIALAGAAFDYGTVPGTPPVGNVNWTAWLDKNIPSPGDPPSEILTEDNTNSSEGVDGGYQNFGGVVRWVMQVENFSNNNNGDAVTIMLGGLGTSSGNVWVDTFNWTNAVSSTDQGQASSLNNNSCPVIDSMSSPGTYTSFTWSGASGTYYIYRSTQESGCCDGTANGASNGRYLYLATVSAPSGTGSYTDNYTGTAWYLVIHADSSGNIDGCHSEIDLPTAVTIGPLSATAKAGYNLLEWQTFLEIELLGFNMYRSESLGGLKDKLNDALIPALNPGGIGVTDYQFIDLNVNPGSLYYYWLEPVEFSGPLAQILSNPVRALYVLYMQLVIK